MIKLLAAGICLALALGAYALVRESHAADPGASDRDAKVVSVADSDHPDYARLYAEVAPGEEDPLSVPFTDGIVWYGTWEDAMAEKERTGKPVMLHFGSPRCPVNGVNVPGTW